MNNKSTWLKNRGYVHLTNQIDVVSKRNEILGKVRNVKFISNHDFFPLIHTVISERRYKKADEGDNSSRRHSHDGKSTAKDRPIHYATHLDSLIFGYYAEILQRLWLDSLKTIPRLSECITAYRRIPDPMNSGKFKSTIHFAGEVFKEIKERSTKACTVLKFDIEKFFSSIDHLELKDAWQKLLDVPTLPEDHYNVFKAATRFSYINRDDLRIHKTIKGVRAGFDEKRLSQIRKSNVVAFFASPAEMRHEIKQGNLRVHKNSFRNKLGETVGIPQGLPISAVLANLYLLKSDIAIFELLVNRLGCYYRRYSDDIIVVCQPEQKEKVKEIVEKCLTENKVVVSISKTEEFYFSREYSDNRNSQISCYQVKNNVLKKGHPLTYLGFEYHGDKILIKSANIAKFYRRMVLAIKNKTKRAFIAASKSPDANLKLFKRRLYKLYTNVNLDKTNKHRTFKRLERNNFGEYVYKVERKTNQFRSNYFNYAERAEKLLGDKHISNQLRRHRLLFNKAVARQRKQLLQQ